MGKSKTRQACEAAEAEFAIIVNKEQANIISPKMLVCGLGGNPRTFAGKPGLDNPHLFSRYNLTTLDKDIHWEPSIIGDITQPEEWSFGEKYDLIHMVQTIEHIPNITDLPYSLNYILAPNGFIIIDCPWGPDSPDYHGVEGNGGFPDLWRISKDGMRYLFEKTFEIIKIIDTSANTSCLMKSYNIL